MQVGVLALGLCGVAGACGGDSPGATADPCPAGAYEDRGSCYCELRHAGDPDVECLPHGDICADAEARVGHRVCAHEIEDEALWTGLSIGGGPPISGLRRLGKYMAPATPTSRVPTVFSDANFYRLHFCLMSVGFAPLFPGLTKAQHAALILSDNDREFFAGAVYEFQDADPVRFGFSVETAQRPDAQLPAETIYDVYRTLADRFSLGDLAYLPRGTLQEEAAATWTDPPFTVISAAGDGVGFETYTPGIAYGRIRRFDPDGAADYSWQDIVVFDEVPLDFEGVVAAAITGQRQDILSHLNVLSAQRGTPNFFVDDAFDVFAQFEGQLVRIETEALNYKLTPATQAEADTFWQTSRPSVAVENPATFDYTALDAFTEIPTVTQPERDEARGRFGAKTVGLATLTPLVDASVITPGLGVPFHYYDAFMRDNRWEPEPGSELSYAETLTAWLDDEAFRSNATVRRERLDALREEMETHGEVDPALVMELRDRIVEVFGDETVMVRLRSSSNAEDTPSFNGAGLYDSESGCAADSFASGMPEVSACDANKSPRSLERGLARVWASLWNYGAFEERDYYQLDHTQIAMGVTVSLRYEAELANGVAFTGDPLDPGAPRYTINAQDGEHDLVDPTPGVTAELSFLTIADGQVAEIDRAVASSLVPAGTPVMTDAHLTELGALLAEIAAAYPSDHDPDSDQTPLLDLEFKITADDRLAIKQIRTFLPSPYAADPTCTP